MTRDSVFSKQHGIGEGRGRLDAANPWYVYGIVNGTCCIPTGVGSCYGTANT